MSQFIAEVFGVVLAIAIGFCIMWGICALFGLDIWA